MTTKTKKGLGKGLDALLGGSRGMLERAPKADAKLESSNLQRSDTADKSRDVDSPAMESPDSGYEAEAGEKVKDLPIESLQPGKYQPRRVIDNESLEELAQSIQNQGVMQPIIVRPLSESEDRDKSGLVKFEIIAGERRWRAVQLAGLTSVPAIVREVNDEAAIAMALIENLQRDNLNPMDEAYALHRLQKEFELTHQEVADAVGKSRTAVSNALRLMNLVSEVKLLLENGDIEMGHARALLALSEGQQGNVAAEVVDKRLSVRQTEALVKSLVKNPGQVKREQPAAPDANIRSLENSLSEKLGAKVQIQHSTRGKGKLVIGYNSLDELDGILLHIK